MVIDIIRKQINAQLAGEQLTVSELEPHMDFVIDEINTMLNAKYPMMSEFTSTDDYNFFPDRFIRLVMVPGAAWHFYVMDEEGVQTALQYQLDYEKGKFIMLRDMCNAVPEEYQDDYEQGFADNNPTNLLTGDRGLDVNGSNYCL